MRADFSDSSLWQPGAVGVGPSITTTGSQGEAVIPAGSHGDGHGGAFWGPTDLSTWYESTFSLHGDFNVEIGYTLASWPSGNGVRFGIAIAPWYGSQRVSLVWLGSPPGDEAYVFDAGGVTAVVGTTDLTDILALICGRFHC